MPERIPATFTNPMSWDDAEALAAAVAALAVPSRLQVISLLHSRPGMSSEQLHRQLPISQSVTVHHTKWLRQAGLVEGAMDGNVRPLRLVPGALERTVTQLREAFR